MLGAARNFASLVKISHTIFGLPFALATAALAHREAVALGDSGLDSARLGLIVAAFAGARAAAMGFNRIVDHDVDAANPRTAGRELPRGLISRPAAWAFTSASALLFLGCAVALGPWPGRLALPCLLLILGYSLVKRFSWTSHLVLGLALALGPGGAWLAVMGDFRGWPMPALSMVAVATWVAGFDVLYSLQDRSFDQRHGLHSIPVRFGIVGSLWLSGALHVLTIAALVALHVIAGLGPVHATGILAIFALLAWEHAIVRPGDLSRIDRAFFDLNGWVSLVYLACTIADLTLA